eukprot:1137820-Pelagomonas_calceolata.AAC.6
MSTACYVLLSADQVAKAVITCFMQADQGAKVVIPFLTHFADLTSWEYARKICKSDGVSARTSPLKY